MIVTTIANASLRLIRHIKTMITIHKSPTADTRTCDFAKTTKEQLLQSSRIHIHDVQLGIKFFTDYMAHAAEIHDHDKITEIDWFHKDFISGFKETGWWDNHRAIHRHHLAQMDGVPSDVNLMDVLEYVADCVMAGMARSGEVYDPVMSPELLETAFQNTVALLKRNVRVLSDPPTERNGTKIGHMVTYAGSEYEVADINSRPGFVGIYDEPPSKHVDYVRWESVTAVRPIEPAGK